MGTCQNLYHAQYRCMTDPKITQSSLQIVYKENEDEILETAIECEPVLCVRGCQISTASNNKTHDYFLLDIDEQVVKKDEHVQKTRSFVLQEDNMIISESDKQPNSLQITQQVERQPNQKRTKQQTHKENRQSEPRTKRSAQYSKMASVVSEGRMHQFSPQISRTPPSSILRTPSQYSKSEKSQILKKVRFEKSAKQKDTMKISAPFAHKTYIIKL